MLTCALFVLCSWSTALSASVPSFHDGRQSFSGHKLYSLSPVRDNRALDQLKSLQSRIEIDFWNQPEPETKVNFRVAPQYQNQLEQFLNSSSLQYSVVTNDIQKWIDRERRENVESDYLSGRQDVKDFKFDFYHTNAEIYSWMDSLEKRFPGNVKVIKIGTTYEKHAIKAIKISGPPGPANESRPAIWMDAGIHAREWVAPATAIYIINELATKQETDEVVKAMTTKFDWYILPVANPDGYQYTWWTNRLWRKNRALPKATPYRYPWALLDDCLGTDPNRNFDVDFGGASTSPNPCSDIFRGDHPFSEKETQAIRDAVLTLGDSLKAFISLHSYSQMWMIPYGYTATKSPHHDDLYEMVSKVVKSVKDKHGARYSHGPIATTIYPAAGSSPDWAHEKAGIKYSFIAELRDLGDHGFILPRSQIIPTAEETWEGIKTIAREIKGLTPGVKLRNLLTIRFQYFITTFSNLLTLKVTQTPNCWFNCLSTRLEYF
ncbi:Carboxypeptidase A2 [Halotydeus destructor]|nr:Carboxypeptidase A2 [Halotydeus destructor]